jgi:ribosomal protein S18 acetylase RimI-like enzyme
MLEISYLAPADLAEAGAVLEAAFGHAGMTEGLRNVYRLQDKYWYCAREDGDIVSLVGAYAYEAQAEAGAVGEASASAVPLAAHAGDAARRTAGTAVAAIGMMGVLPQAQRRGLGFQMMSHLVAHLEANGCPAMFLEASAAGQHLYPKLSFLDCGRTLRMVRHLAPPPSPRSVAGAEWGLRIRPMAFADLPAVTELDSGVFGLRRADIIRSLYERFSDRAFLVQDAEGHLAGYLIAAGSLLGPWCASSSLAAEALLQGALALPYFGEWRVTLPADNEQGRALLLRYGFTEGEGLLHMRLNSPVDPRRRTCYYGQASLMLG